MLDMMWEYGLRIMPGLILIALTYVLLPRKTVAFRLFMLIFGFILIRDVMTPLGFWEFGVADENTMWVRFIDNGPLLITFGIVSLLVTAAVWYGNRSLNSYLVWFGPNKWLSAAVGVAGAAVVVAPFLFLYGQVPVEDRGGAVSLGLLWPLLTLALLGNFMEEVLFRGYVQGYLEQFTGMWRAAVLSGLLFAAGHIFLSATVTGLGVTVLIFTLYEGLVCALVRMKYGIMAAALTHGLAIFVLSSGLL